VGGSRPPLSHWSLQFGRVSRICQNIWVFYIRLGSMWGHDYSSIKYQPSIERDAIQVQLNNPVSEASRMFTRLWGARDPPHTTDKGIHLFGTEFSEAQIRGREERTRGRVPLDRKEHHIPGMWTASSGLHLRVLNLSGLS